MPLHRIAALSLLTLACAQALAAPAGLEKANMDPAVAPDESFFRYANGAWLKRTQIPADRSSTGVGREVQELTDLRVRGLIEGAGHGQPKAGSEAQRIADYFGSFMDEAGIEKQGLAPLKPALAAIAAITDRAQLATALGGMLRADADILNNTSLYTPNPLGVWVAADLDEPTRYTVFLVQGGLSMPDREYYLDDAKAMADTRAAFMDHLAKTFALAGFGEPQARAARVFALERKLAASHATRADTAQVEKGDNHWRAGDFDKKAPGLAWKDFFAAASLDKQADFTVWQPSAVTGLSALAASEPLEAWKDWLTFHAVDAAARFLPKKFADQYFEFHAHVLSGTPQQEARWKRGVSWTNDVLGDDVGRLYVTKYFPPADKARAEAMVRDLVAAFGRRIDALSWMAPATKARARAKLAVLKIGVSYPDRWRDNAALEIRRGDALGNQQRAERFKYRRALDKLGTPVDRGEWVMNPQLVNAVNLPVLNAMNFPAAILQPPYFDVRRTAAMNYGAIGSIIGHEISHSFDDQGALFDDSGRLKNWWTKEDFAHFSEAGKALAAQYDAYQPLPDMAIKGEQVLSENIADLAGLAVAYDAWRASPEGQKPPVVQGFTGEQQFFIAFAQGWRTKMREAAMRQRLLTDGHALAEFRVATVRNLDPFYEAFKTAPGHALYLAPADRVRVW